MITCPLPSNPAMFRPPHVLTYAVTLDEASVGPAKSCVRFEFRQSPPNPGTHHVTATSPEEFVPARLIPPHGVRYAATLPTSGGAPVITLRLAPCQSES